MTTDIERLLLRETPDAVVLTTPDGKVVYWNEGAERVFEYTRAQAIGRTLKDLTVPLDRQSEQREFAAAAVVSGLATYETMRQKSDGSLVHVAISNKLVRGSDGQGQYILSTKKDISDLRIMRDARQVGWRFGDLLESIPDAIILASPTGRIVLANSQAEQLFGYKRGELRGAPVETLLPERYRRDHVGHRSKYFVAAQARTMGTGLELFGLRKDGEEFSVEISLSPLETDEGTLVMSAIRDTRERKKAEQQSRGLLESAPDAIVVVNGQGKIVLVNSQTEKLFGYPRSELLGKDVGILVPDRYRNHHQPQLNGFFTHPRTRSMSAGLDLHGLRRDGTEFPADISLSPFETEDGLLVSSAIRDITDRKRIQRDLHEKNIELRTAAEAKNRFLANMSHELRTPLNGVIGFAEFLIDGKPGPLNARQQEYLTDILNSGKHLLQLINDVLDLAKVEAGKMEFNPELFDLRKAIGDVCAVAKPVGQKKTIEVSSEVDDGITLVHLDQQKFKQILYNLLSNAIKFTEDGGRVNIVAKPEDSQSFSLSVEDTGIGIKEVDLRRLFQEFEQLDSGASRRYEGTGLGLALTRRIVELQGGSIRVESEVSKGSTFTVTLPRIPEETSN